MPNKPLFSGLSVDDPKPSEIYRESFTRQQAEMSARAHLKTPTTPPMRRKRPQDIGAEFRQQAPAQLVTTRSSKYGVRPSVGTPTVPAGLRRSAGEKISPVAKDGRRKTRAASKSRAKSSEKIAYNGRVGMTAAQRMTDVKREQLTREITERHAKTLAVRGAAMVKEAAAERADAKRLLADALGRERDARTRGDIAGAAAAREDVKKFRKLSNFKGK